MAVRGTLGSALAIGTVDGVCATGGVNAATVDCRRAALASFCAAAARVFAALACAAARRAWALRRWTAARFAAACRCAFALAARTRAASDRELEDPVDRSLDVDVLLDELPLLDGRGELERDEVAGAGVVTSAVVAAVVGCFAVEAGFFAVVAGVVSITGGKWIVMDDWGAGARDGVSAVVVGVVTGVVAVSVPVPVPGPPGRRRGRRRGRRGREPSRGRRRAGNVGFGSSNPLSRTSVIRGLL